MSDCALSRLLPDPEQSCLPDEKLIAVAHTEHDRAAADTVIFRYSERVENLGRHWARRAGVGKPDLPDAEQSALLALVFAVHDFEATGENLSPGSFQSFLWTFVSRRMTDFMRGIRRYERRLSRSFNLSACEDEPEDGERKEPYCRAITDESADPALMAESEEFMACLLIAVKDLEASDEWLWKQISAGIRQRVLALDMGVSCRTVRRRSNRLLAAMAERLCRRLPDLCSYGLLQSRRWTGVGQESKGGQ